MDTANGIDTVDTTNQNVSWEQWRTWR